MSPKPEQPAPPPPETKEEPGEARRRGLVIGGAAALALAAASKLVGTAAAAPEAATKAGAKRARPIRWGMVIDLDRCNGCGACVGACRVENNVPTAGAEQEKRDRAIFWMDLLREREGEFPEFRERIIPTPCNHCRNAPCVKVCPVGATSISDEGIVQQIWGRCIGCRFCTVACPYTRRSFNFEAPKFTEGERARLNPDVSTRPVGVVEKCTFCHHRIRKAELAAKEKGRPLTDEEVHRLPACAEGCPTGAITFGDLDDPESLVAALAKDPRASRLQEELGTEPKVYYLGKKKW